MICRIFVLTCIALLAGCATTPPFTNYAGKDAACISGGMVNPFKFFGSGEAHTAVREIDGVPSPGSGPFCLSPGNHRLGVSAAAKGYQQAQDYINVELLPATRYDIRGQLVGISILVTLVELGEGGAEQEVAKYPLLAGARSQSSSIPIFIPVKK